MTADQTGTQASLVVKYFLDNFPVELVADPASAKNKKEELAAKYISKLTEVFLVFDRLIRYEIYFKEFYPAKETGISEPEVIEYHLRAYVQDFYILSNRIKKICDELVSDLQYYNPPDRELCVAAIKHISQQMRKTLEEVIEKSRHKHVHDRSISDIELVKGQFFDSVLSKKIDLGNLGNNPALLKIISERYSTLVPETKTKYIEMASKNSISIGKQKEWFAARFGTIFATINGHDASIFDMNAHEST